MLYNDWPVDNYRYKNQLHQRMLLLITGVMDICISFLVLEFMI